MNVRTQIWAFLLGLYSLTYVATSVPLGSYGGDPNAVSVSGISAGAAFSVQFHVAFSSEVMGAGIVDGVVYYCAGATVSGAELCMSSPELINVDYLVQITKNTAATGFADNVSNMQGDQIFIFDGTLDSVVNPVNGQKTAQYYSSFGANILTEFSVAAEHCMPTDDYGNACSTLASPYISRCQYNAAYKLLNHIYGNLQEPSGSVPLNGDFYEFDQSEFVSGSASSISFDTTGYVYVPSYCTTNRGCKVHLAFHGCLQGRDTIGDTYVRNAGYNEVAELNNIIIVYPQVVKSSVVPMNPNGCYDWWGYTSVNYASNIGPQMVAVHNMLERVLS